MKKITYYSIAIFILLNLSYSPSFANEVKNTPITAKSHSSTEATFYINRLNEINEMDKSNLGKPKKKLLRKEVTAIKKKLESLDGGIYISVGAIIIILLLIIILF